MSANNTFCPYVGLQPYTESDSDYFFGRETDLRIISSNLFASPLTILYGSSGVGKSSVLLAGVVPRLRTASRTAVVVFRDWQGRGFLRRLKSQCIKAVENARNKTLEIDEGQPLDELLFVVSQEFGGTILILLDQFEEYFLYHPESRKANPFDAEFARAVNREEVDASFLIVLREDGLSKMDRFRARIHNLLENTLRLRHLDITEAENAICKPLDVYNLSAHAASTGPMVIEDKLVYAVLEQVQPGRVLLSKLGGVGKALVEEETSGIETPFLQLVMTRLWKEERQANSNTLRFETFKRLGGAQEIVRKHLDDTMEMLDANEQTVCANFFDRLVTPSGSKIACNQSDLTQWAGKLSTYVPSVLKSLSEARILRSVASAPGEQSETSYEIFHDVIAPAILDWRTRFVQARETAEARRKAEEQAKIAKRLRRFSYALVGLAIAAYGFAMFAWTQRQEAKENEQKAIDAARADSLKSIELTKALSKANTNEKKAIDSAKADSLKSIELTKALSKANINEKKAIDSAKADSLKSIELTKALSKANINEKDAKTQANRADSLLRIFKAQTLAAAALLQAQLGNDTLSVLLARQAYKLNLQNPGTFSIQEVYEALRKTLNTPGFSKPGNETGGPRMKRRNDDWTRIAAYSPDGKWIASGSGDGIVYLWNPAQDTLYTLRGHKSGVRALAFSPGGDTLASGSDDKTVKLWWNWDKPKKNVKTLTGHRGRIRSISYRPDGKMLASGDGSGHIILWNLRTPNMQQSDQLHYAAGIRAVAFSPGGEAFAFGSDDGNVSVWELAKNQTLNLTDEKPMKTFTQTASINSIAFSPDGRILATGSDDKIVRLWSWREQDRAPKELIDHEGGVTSVAFSKDGQFLASGSYDKTIRLWDRQAMQIPDTRPLVLREHDSWIFSVAFSKDGNTLVSASADRSIGIWTTRAAILAELVCQKARRNLSPDEWDKFIGPISPYEPTCPN